MTPPIQRAAANDESKKDTPMHHKAMPQAEVIRLLDLHKRRIAKQYTEQLTALEAEVAQLRSQLAEQATPTAYDNCPGEDRNIAWKKQLAILRGGVERRELKTFGQSAVKNWLKDQGEGCSGEKAKKLMSRLEDEGCLVRGPDGKLGYPPVDRAA
jgi:hypothetical protein